MSVLCQVSPRFGCSPRAKILVHSHPQRKHTGMRKIPPLSVTISIVAAPQAAPTIRNLKVPGGLSVPRAPLFCSFTAHVALMDFPGDHLSNGSPPKFLACPPIATVPTVVLLEQGEGFVPPDVGSGLISFRTQPTQVTTHGRQYHWLHPATYYR